jgi:hypothetical protein
LVVIVVTVANVVIALLLDAMVSLQCYQRRIARWGNDSWVEERGAGEKKKAEGRRQRGGK